MFKERISELRQAYLARRPDGEAIWQGYRDRWAAVAEQIKADKPLVQTFLAAHGTAPQALRALNLIAERSGFPMVYRDASVTHEAPAGLQ